MKRALCLCFLLLIIPLWSCNVKEPVAWEYVHDDEAPPSLPAFYITAEIPKNVFLTEASDEGRYAVFRHGDYTIIQEIFTAESPDAAFLHLTGRDSASLSPVCLTHFPREEYRFVWTAAEGATPLNCWGKLIRAGRYFYSLSILCDAAAAPEHQEDFFAILSSMELEAV